MKRGTWLTVVGLLSIAAVEFGLLTTGIAVPLRAGAAPAQPPLAGATRVIAVSVTPAPPVTASATPSPAPPAAEPPAAGAAGSAAPGQPAPDKRVVDPDLWDAISKGGDADVIVSLRRSGAPGGQAIAVAMAEVGAAQSRVLSSVAAADFSMSQRYAVVPGFAGKANVAAVRVLAAQPDVLRISLDQQAQASLAQAVPLVNADDAHALGFTGQGVVVAVLDTGIDTDHPALADDILYQRCFLSVACPSAPNVAEDGYSHGSHVSGIITSNGAVGSIGIAPDAQIAAYKVLDDTGSGSFSDLLAALDDIIVSHPEVDLVNMSLGMPGTHYAPGTCESVLPAMTTALETLRSQGVTTFIAAGNSADKDGVSFPACITAALSIGAVYDANNGYESWFSCTDPTTAADQVTCFSQSDGSLDLLAPGSAIDSTVPGGGTANYSGTSMASPAAAAVAALLLDAEPGLTPDQVEARLTATGTPILDPANGVIACRVDALKAIQNPGGTPCETVAPPPPPPPPNDDIGGAIPVGPTPWQYSQSTNSATTAAGEPQPCGGIGKTVWFVYTADFTGMLSVDTFGSGFDTVLAAYDTSATPGATLDCNDDFSGRQSQIRLAVTSGSSYYLQLGGFNGASGSLLVNVDVATGPPNDNITNAQFITPSFPSSYSQSTTGGTLEPGEPQPCGGIAATVWFLVTPAANGTLEADTFGSGFDTVLAAYQHPGGVSPPGGLDPTPLDCNDDSGGLQSQISFPVVAGVGYLIQAGGFSGAAGPLQIHLDCAPDHCAAGGSSNDNVENAASVPTPLPFSYGQTTVGATLQPGEPQPCGGMAATVWFTFTASESGTLGVTSFGSDFDTVLAAYAASFSPPGVIDPVPLACNDDSGGLQSFINFPVAAGITYFVQAGGYFGRTGNLAMSFDWFVGGQISGTITDALSTPIAGANVWACPTFSGSCGGATSAADGTYTIMGLSAGDYRVQASGPYCPVGPTSPPCVDYVTEYYYDTYDYSSATLVPVASGVTTPNINFALALGGRVIGTVTDALGTPIAGANVWACPTFSGSCGWVTSAADGTYTITGLPEGDYRVQASAPGYVGEYYNDTYDWNLATLVPVTSGVTTPNIDFALALAGSISGTVTDALATPIAGVNVWACPTFSGSCGSATTAADGTYIINDLAPGCYIVEVSASGYASEYYDNTYDYSAATPVCISSGVTTPNINFALEVGGQISGTITDVLGTPIAGADVWANSDTCCGGRGATTAADGTYTIADLAPGTYRVQASGPYCPAGPTSPPCVDYVSEYYNDTHDWSAATLVPVTSGVSTPNINFALALGGRISGTVTDALGTPIAGAYVWATRATCCGDGGTTSAADGTYTITGLPEGSYRLRASGSYCPSGVTSPPCIGYAGEYYDDTYDYSSATLVPATSGVTTPNIDFALALGGQISGTITDALGTPIAGAWVSADRNAGAGGGGWATTATDGTYVITSLAPGSDVVSASAPGYAIWFYNGTCEYLAATPVSVTSGGTATNIDITLRPANPDCFDHAISIGGLPFTDTRSTAGATTAPGESLPNNCGNMGATVWYEYTAPFSSPPAYTTMSVDTVGSSFNTAVAVYSQGVSPPGVLTLVGCKAAGSASLVNFTATPGWRYYFQIGGQLAATGGLVVNVSPDTDGDGYTDIEETRLGENPLQYCDILRADVNMDGKVALGDLILIAAWYLKTIPPAPPRYDQNNDGKITLADLVLIARRYLQPVSACP